MLKRRLLSLLVVFSLLIPLVSPTAAARVWPTVRQGDSGENVVTLQYMLRHRGYTLSVDGAFGPGTDSVVRSFQSANGLVADGIVGTNTWEKVVVMVRQGNSNVAVTALQRQLKNKYNYNVPIDGVFGASTHTAVVGFQSSRGLSADGIVGLDTWSALLSGATGGGGSGGDKLSHSQALSMLNAAGISVVSSGNCSDRYVSTCTSLEQVRRASIDGTINFKRASGCTVTVTGGTETGHSGGTYSHWNGYKIDIALNSCVNNYITSRYTYIGVRGDGAAQYRDGSGNIYARESHHWDNLYY